MKQYISKFVKTKKEAIDFLENGGFVALDTVSAKEILDYMLEKRIVKEEDMSKKSPLEEDLNKAGCYSISASRLQFYPTDFLETLRSVSALPLSIKGGYKTLLNGKQRMTLDRVLDRYEKEKGNEIEIFLELANMRRVDIIEKMFIVEFENAFSNSNGFVTVVDPFGGTGSWLDVFRMLDNKRHRRVKTIYNEIELNKYDEFRNRHDYSFNLPAEDFLPMLGKKVVPDIILFNPPYGHSFGERNARNFLMQLRDSMVFRGDSIMLCALNEKDIRDCMDILERYEITEANRFKNDEEFKALGQYYFEVKANGNRNGKQVLTEMLNRQNTEKRRMSPLIKQLNNHDTNKKWFLEELELKADETRYIAPRNNLDFIKSSLIPKAIDEVIYMPKNPSFEETCSLIANGKMNGKVIMRDGQVVYVCGVNEKVTETMEDEGEDGEGTVTIQKEIYSTTITVIDENKRLKILSDREGGWQ